jgi:hypothetical protein
VAPAGLNVMLLLLAIGVAVAVGAVIAVVDIRRSSRPRSTPTLVASEPAEESRSERRVA